MNHPTAQQLAEFKRLYKEAEEVALERDEFFTLIYIAARADTAKALRGAADEIEQLHETVDQLDAGLKRTGSDNRRLRAEIDEMRGNGAHLLHQLDQARAENAQLRAALKEIADMRYSNTSASTIAFDVLERHKQNSGADKR